MTDVSVPDFNIFNKYGHFDRFRLNINHSYF
jgi:hypothetical protein